MHRTPLANPPGDRDSAAVANDLAAASRGDLRLPFDTGVSSAVVSPGTNCSVVRVSRRVASVALGGTHVRDVSDVHSWRTSGRLVPWARGSVLDLSSHPPPSSEEDTADGYASAATISRAVSLSLQSTFQRSLAVRLVRYRNRGVISLGRASPANFGLRNKAALLARGRRQRRRLPTLRGCNSLWPLATFQIVLRRARRLRLSSSQLRAP